MVGLFGCLLAWRSLLGFSIHEWRTVHQFGKGRNSLGDDSSDDGIDGEDGNDGASGQDDTLDGDNSEEDKGETDDEEASDLEESESELDEEVDENETYAGDDLFTYSEQELDEEAQTGASDLSNFQNMVNYAIQMDSQTIQPTMLVEGGEDTIGGAMMMAMMIEAPTAVTPTLEEAIVKAIADAINESINGTGVKIGR